MSPFLDIYGLTKNRDAATIDRFLDTYVDREASEDRGDEELMLAPLDDSADLGRLEDAEWEPALTLTHSIERGLAYPRRSFTIHLKSKRADINGVILSFTKDDQLVLGLYIDDEGMWAENALRAKALLDQLVEHCRCYLGWIVAEEPPPASEAAFRAAVAHPVTSYFYAADRSIAVTLTLRQLEVLRAAVDRILPSDDFSSGWDAGVGDYLQRQFQGDLSGLIGFYRVGLDALDAEARKANGAGFVELDASAQDALLSRIDRGTLMDAPTFEARFFRLLVEHAMEGYYSDPGNGGNRDGAAWRMIGFEVRG